jgi:hypothetical protein
LTMIKVASPTGFEPVLPAWKARNTFLNML